MFFANSWYLRQRRDNWQRLKKFEVCVYEMCFRFLRFAFLLRGGVIMVLQVCSRVVTSLLGKDRLEW